jgi:cytochrome P450
MSRWHEWGKEYGDIIGLKFGPQNVVVLNNFKHVKEYEPKLLPTFCWVSDLLISPRLFDKRGSMYSSRPESYIGQTLLCPNNIHILLTPYGPAYRKLRKIFQQLMTPTAVDSLLPIQDAESTLTLLGIIKTPDRYYGHIRRLSTAIILASVFGERGKDFTSRKVQELYRVQDEFTAILEPGATPPVDIFPILKLAPEWMAGWKRWANKVGRDQRGLYMRWLEEAKERFAHGGPDCYLKTVVKEQEKFCLNDMEMAYIGGSFVSIRYLFALILGQFLSQQLVSSTDE